MTASSVQPATQRVERALELRVARRQTHRSLELPQGVPPTPLPHMDPREIHVRELARLVSLGQLGPLEPGHGLVELPLLHEVAPDVVVRIAEVRVDLDGAQAFLCRLLQAALEAVGPPEEGVGFGRRARLERALVELDRAVELPLHLVAVGFPPEHGRPAEAFRVVHRITRSATPRAAGPCPRTSTRSDSS